MAKKNKLWFSGEDAQLAARFTKCLTKALYNRRASYLRAKAEQAASEISIEECSEEVDKMYTPTTRPVEEIVESKLMWESIRKYLHLLKARTVKVCPRRAVVDVGIVHANLRILLQIAGNNHLLGFNGYAVRVGILHRKTDVDRGAASGVGLLHGHRSRFFPAFSRHAQPTFLCS